MNKTQNTNNFGGSWVSSCPVFLRASTAATYIFTAPTCTATMITLQPFALNEPDLIKFSYFADTTEREVWEWKEAQR
jgi:hypothetical protein